MKKSFMFIGIIVVAALMAVSLIAPSISSAAPKGDPVVIGYVGNVASPGTKPCMDIQKMAVEELNAAAGIMGRPIKYIVMDGKGDTSLSVEAFRKLVIEDKAKFVSIEGRTEICLAVQEASSAVVKEYPHILMFNGAAGSDVTGRIVDNVAKYNHCFRDWMPEAAYWAHMRYFFNTYIQKVLKVKKIAILWEDLAWTSEFRKGIPSLGLPPWEQMCKEAGVQIVYSKLVKPRGTLYFPILQQIAAAKPDLIYYVSSWFTDTESFAKQWADSAAKNIQVQLEGGVSMTQDFWKMTGGKALGMTSVFTDVDTIALTPLSIPVVKKAKSRNIPMQLHVHLAYADIYHFKSAFEKAKGSAVANDMVKAFEDVETVYSLGKLKFETRKIKPFYHSAANMDASSVYKSYPGRIFTMHAQFQKGGKVVYISSATMENEKLTAKFYNVNSYKKPAELRK